MRFQTVAITLVAFAAAAVPARAEDKKDAKPALSGTWAKKDGQLKIEFVDKEMAKFYPHGDKEFVIVCKYSIDKDGLVKAKITDLEGKAEIKEKAKGSLPVGLEMSFSWQAKGDAATLDNLKGENTEGLKSHLEGEFSRKAD
jgi:hypothetical protein